MLYNFFIRLFLFGIRLAAPFVPKARKWVDGRRNWRSRYRADFQKKSRVLWVHAASLGEFEQGRPVIEGFRQQHPDWQIVLSFFSPSGYEIRKNYPHADFIAYLPADTPANARDWLDLIRPDAAVFVKYEFWANYLFALKKRQTPTVLISALFRPDQAFFRWYGGFWRRMLGCFDRFFVQNEASARLLGGIGIEAVEVAGDTRVDRVLQIAETAPANALVAQFSASAPATLIVGSSWPADEDLLIAALAKPEFQDLKVVFAPHEPAAAQVQQLETRLKNAFPQALVARYSQSGEKEAAAARFLIIDNIGMLNTLYRYGWIAYIGGGFGRGIHNTLEPAAWGLPVVFGPKYHKFEEARQLAARGGGFAVGSADELEAALRVLMQPEKHRAAVAAIHTYLTESRGATRRVLAFLDERLAS
ncbi:MAG: 3-deoxy-D-manno-octulosonic acid transferase [Saprospiraceae bacterium]|nr:3-deoxy-D-manno-octulosonic acid transferase [Saprospiraceae bacterium]